MSSYSTIPVGLEPTDPTLRRRVLYPVELWNLYLMRREGLEPSRTEVYTGLNRVRLPISPSAL